MIIRRAKTGTYVVKSRDGRSLGQYRTEAEARERLRQVEAAKHAKAKGKRG